MRGLKDSGLPLHFVVTVNTRSPRADEKEGVDYIFIGRAEFERMREAGELLEDAKVYNDYKGVPREQVRAAMASGKDVLMRLDVQGAETIREVAPDALLIFLTTASEDELIERLRGRKTESAEDLALRLETAHEEFSHLDNFDYVVANREDALEETVAAVVGIIRAEHQRVLPRRVQL